MVGRKHLPEEGTYFSFVESVANGIEELKKALEITDYDGEEKGESQTPGPRCLGEGSYLLLEHSGHTHLCYYLRLPEEPGEVQKQFNLKHYEDYLITVKRELKFL